MSIIVELSYFESLIADLETNLDKVQLHHLELEKFITWSMDEVYSLSQTGENDDLKMQIVALEYRTRLLLERCNKVGLNWWIQ